MKAVKRMNATGHFNWIGSDGWSARALVSEGKKHVDKMGSVYSLVFTTIGCQIQKKMPKSQKYYAELTLLSETLKV